MDVFIVIVFCLIDETIPAVLDGQRLRERGPAPMHYDSEVVTMEIVGEYLGLEQESALFAYFRRHYTHFFLAVRHLHRTTLVRQAANLWWLKERLWQRMLGAVPHDSTFAIVDSIPLPTRVFECRCFECACYEQMRAIYRMGDAKTLAARHVVLWSPNLFSFGLPITF